MAFGIGEGYIDLPVDHHSPAYVVAGREGWIGRVKGQFVKRVLIYLQEISSIGGFIGMKVHPESDAGQ